ncbi:MAG TPA: ABC transporter permease [Pyrinomonadaceae bacterium]|jgi:putative ABC transport system permease protein|nr:ABC transporter permease [Pyrinomonadaceae bacterium]
MASLARRNLFHDRVRLLVTLTGIVFSVVLATIQLGLFVGFQTATADVIDNSRADLWVVSQNVGHLEAGVPFSERKLYQIKSVPGVAAVEKQIVQFGDWKLPNGAVEGILLVGFNPAGEMGGPWQITAGSVADLRSADTVMIDELYREKLGVTRLGQQVEIRGVRARVVGFTRGIRTFTTSPATFTSFKNAQNYYGLREDQTIYLLVKAAPGVDPEELRERLAARLTDVDVYTRDEWSRKQQFYWMFGTGAGVTVLIAAALGLLVGVVVVAQTIYAATVDHIREYGTLKAMGATNGYIYRVIVKQAVISALIGYGVGIGVSLLVSYVSRQGTTAVRVPWPLAVGLFFATLLMCVGASVVSINKVTRLDPAMVFKG